MCPSKTSLNRHVSTVAVTRKAKCVSHGPQKENVLIYCPQSTVPGSATGTWRPCHGSPVTTRPAFQEGGNCIDRRDRGWEEEEEARKRRRRSVAEKEGLFRGQRRERGGPRARPRYGGSAVLSPKSRLETKKGRERGWMGRGGQRKKKNLNTGSTVGWRDRGEPIDLQQGQASPPSPVNHGRAQIRPHSLYLVPYATFASECCLEYYYTTVIKQTAQTNTTVTVTPQTHPPPIFCLRQQPECGYCKRPLPARHVSCSRSTHTPAVSSSSRPSGIDLSTSSRNALHLLLMRWCWQRLAPPHSLHVLLRRWCWQMLAPPHSLHRLLMRWWWQKLAPCTLCIGSVDD